MQQQIQNKGQYRKAFQLLEKNKYKFELNLEMEIQITRRIVYCGNKIILDYLNRNVDLEKKTIRSLLAKLRLLLIRWFEIMKVLYKNKKSSKMKICLFLVEMMKFSQHLSHIYSKQGDFELTEYFAMIANQFQELIYSFQLQAWKITSKINYNSLILGCECLSLQHYDQSILFLENNISSIQIIFKQMNLYKLKNGLTELQIRPISSRYILNLLFTSYLLLHGYLYSDQFQKYNEMLNLMQYLAYYNHSFKELTRRIKIIIKQNHKTISTYLQEIGELQLIISNLIDRPQQTKQIEINPIDNMMYNKTNVKQLNRQQMIRLNIMPKLHLYEPPSNSILHKSQKLIVTRKLQTSPENLTTNQTESHRQPRKNIKKESFSHMQSERSSIKYFIDKKIQDCLKRDSFFSYNEISREVDTNISMDSDQNRSKRAVSDALKSRRFSTKPPQVTQATKNALFNLIEAKSLYYMEVQKATMKLNKIQQQKDALQKKQISDKLIQDIKIVNQQPKILQSQDMQEMDAKTPRQIYQEVFLQLKQVADTYQTQTTIKKKQESNFRNRTNSNAFTSNPSLKKSDLAISVQKINR